MKKLLSMFLACVLLLGILPTSAWAADSVEAALGEVDIYNGGYELGYLSINGAVKKQDYTYFMYKGNDGVTREVPAYCVNPYIKGVPQKVEPGESIKYLAEERSSDPKVVGIISNGYPHRSLGELNLDNKYQAYYATVFETALRQMAEQAGIRTTDSMVNDAIIQSGYFSNESGSFDPEVYKAASTVEKSAIRAQIEEILPSQMVLGDIADVRTSDAENEFVAALNANARAFQYITVGAETYPDTDAWTYAEENPAPFQTMDLSSITVATSDEASSILSSIQSGEATFESAAAEKSTDSYSDAEGAMGAVMYTDLEGQLADSTNAATVFSASVGDIVGPFQTYTGYALYRINSESMAADLEEAENLNAVKEYIASNDPETMDAYLKAKADEVYALAQGSWDDAAAVYGVTVTDVGGVTL